MIGNREKAGKSGNLNISKRTSMNALILASMLALSINSVYSEELAPVPLSQDNNSQGTLDKLAGQDIPNTDPVQKYPSSGSSYILTKLQEGGEKPAGDNIVTKFTYNSETQTMNPVYYRLDLKQTTYGEGDTTKYYGWTKDEKGDSTLVEVNQQNANITVKYNKFSCRYFFKF